MSDDILFKGGGYLVTRTLLRTQRKTYALRQIEYVSVERAMLWFAGLPAAALILFGLRFFRYLGFFELLMLLGFSGLGIWLAAQIGTLRVHSFALQDQDTSSYGLISHLRSVRNAVEQAMEARGTEGVGP